MKKPTVYEGEDISINSGYDLFEILDFIDKKYKINSRDMKGSKTHYKNWCKEQGLGKKDPEGKSQNSSNIWYQQYQKSPTGEVLRPEYLCFFSWFYNQYTVNFGETFTFDVIDDMSQENVPEYIVEILTYIKKDFGDSFEAFLSES